MFCALADISTYRDKPIAPYGTMEWPSTIMLRTCVTTYNRDSIYVCLITYLPFLGVILRLNDVMIFVKRTFLYSFIRQNDRQ